MDKLPTQVGNSTPENSSYLHPTIKVVFIDEAMVDFKPDLEYYRKLYTEAGYPTAAINSLLKGLSKSSLYEGKTA